MEFIQTGIEGLMIIQPKVWEDPRGYFFESYSEAAFVAHGIPTQFVQDNQSKSQKGTLRGLHFQATPHAQGKLVRVVRGAVLDVAVDLRVGSPTFGKHQMVELSDKNHTIFWVPPGFAHGFLTLTDDAIFTYKCTGLYNKAAEGGLLWNDTALGIDWGITDPVISEKDAILPTLKELISPFIF